MYSALALPFHHALRIRVDAEHRGPFEIVVPEPADVDLVFEDEATGEAIQPSSVACGAVRMQDALGWDQETGHFSFRAPAGPIEIWATVNATPAFYERELFPGPNAIRVLVAAPCGIRLALMAGQEPIRPADSSFRSRGPTVSGSAGSRASSRSRPGRWSLRRVSGRTS